MDWYELRRFPCDYFWDRDKKGASCHAPSETQEKSTIPQSGLPAAGVELS